MLILILGLSVGPPLSGRSPSTTVAAQQEDPGDPVVVASKPFGESYLLGEMFAQLLESRGFAVDRRLGLGATEIAFQAVRTGAVDVYPEYTGTGLLAILDEDLEEGDARRVYRRVRRVFRDRWGVHWLAPLGFENTYAIAVRRQTADSLNLRTLSDLAEVGSSLVGAFSPDFLGREDGLPGLRRAYDLQLAETRSLLQAVKYEALAEGRVDVIDGYSTDGFIARYDLVVLEDDRDFFPPYEAAAVVGRRLWDESPGAVRALNELAGLMDEDRVRELNRRLEVGAEPLSRVARDGLSDLGLVDADVESAGPARTGESPPDLRADESLLGYLWNRRGEIVEMASRHLILVGISLGAAVLLAVPLGLILERTRDRAETVIRGFGLLQTLPSIALLAFMIPLLGIGVTPALVALFLYSLFPILRNTYSGVRDVDAVIVDSARALGMTRNQILLQVRLPLAAPFIMAGIRTAAIINVGTATLAAFIGAGGLGDPIVSGLALSDTRMILSGAIPAAVLAVAVDRVLSGFEKLVSPEGLAPSGTA
ncbi:MAG: glycine betaine ABC transporter substrate-binding protein [Longimicrobiales bacterium]|nr:glycine betaine ABC transporter substrate-binding protein [Longimicrobiales bacterium]